MSKFESSIGAAARTLVLSLSCMALNACSGADPATTSSGQGSALAQSFSMTLPSMEASDPMQSQALPTFHAAPVILEEPDDTDALEPMTSSMLPPHLQAVPSEFAALSTRRLTRQVLDEIGRTGNVPGGATADSQGIAPRASSSLVATYTPAQIRAAYGLPLLPAAGATITSAQAAQLGAGQTIYIIDAQHDPNAAAELAAFNQKFGLPGCAVTPISASASLPLAAAPATGCLFSVVYSTAGGAMTASPPAYDSGWATEIALDVQWSHATAPLARIILIEAPDASSNSLSAAVSLADEMGPGVVSQSFGATEGSWTAAFDAVFTAANMTYLAAAGDAGASVDWPAVSTHVVAVGGTSLTYTGSGPRSEVAWSGTGGGVSQYVATPGYQTDHVVGLGPPSHRAVTDVSFNADPSTGQYLAIIPQGSSTPEWMSVGGTSLATPQWAGLFAVANAVRAQNALSPLGAPHSALYQLATGSGSYSSDFLDITQGADGSCASCVAGTGYDLPTGLGTPNAGSLLTALAGSSPAPVAPVVTGATVQGTAGAALSFTVSASGAHALSYSLSGAPAGMSINPASGAVSWADPIAGSYSVTAIAKDTQTGLAGQAVLSVSIVAPKPPVLTGGSVTGTAGIALNFTVSVQDANPVTFSLSNAPSGMTVSPAGVVSWTPPAAGSYSLTAVAHDSKTGLTGQGVFSLVIAAPQPPKVTAQTITGTTGKALSFTVSVTASDPLTYSLSGAPSGMSISSSGVITWSNPAAGTYKVTVIAKDTRTGLSGQGICTVTIARSGPVITATALTGVAGHPLAGTISFSDSTSNSLGVSIGGIPAGMTLSLSGPGTISIRWSSPVTGNYTLSVTVTDGSGLKATLNVPVSISSH